VTKLSCARPRATRSSVGTTVNLANPSAVVAAIKAAG
jgi:hypothetical protein